MGCYTKCAQSSSACARVPSGEGPPHRRRVEQKFKGRNTSGAQADKHHEYNILFVAEIELKHLIRSHDSLMFDSFICSLVRTLHVFPFRYRY
jgi:hypothetical protein